MKQTLTIVGLITFLVILSMLLHWGDRLHYFFYEKTHQGAHSSLNNYQLVESIRIPQIENLSGVVYNPENNSLFMILNSPESLVECDLKGRVLRTIRLEGFKDTEGICYNDSGQLVVIEERRQSLITLPPITSQSSIHRDDVPKAIEMKMFAGKNIGFEGVSYSSHHQSFFIVKEKGPAAVLQVTGDSNHQKIKRLFKIKSEALRVNDFSGIFCHPNGNLLLLSDESAVVTECQIDGTVLGYLELDKGFRGGANRIPQAEGICLDEQGTLYIVSEPNLLYIFRPQ